MKTQPHPRPIRRSISLLTCIVLVSCLFSRASTQEQILASNPSAEVVSSNLRKLYLKSNGNIIPLGESKTNCSFLAKPIGSQDFVIGICGEKLNKVIDSQGNTRFTLPAFEWATYVANNQETYFAVYERGRSFWHDLGDKPYDKMRLLVYSLSDGKKVLEYRWKAEQDERVDYSFAVKFSEDGSKLRLERVFASNKPPIDKTFDLPKVTSGNREK